MGYLYHGNQNLSNSDICASSVLNTELNKTCSYLDYQNKLALFEKNRKVKKEQDYRQYINWKREYLNNHYYDNRTGTYAEYSPLTTYGGGLLAGIAGAFQTGIPMSLISSIFIDTPAAYEAGKSINQYNQQLYLAQQMAQNYPYPNYAYPPTINGYPLLVPRNQFLLTPPPQSLSQGGRPDLFYPQVLP